MLSREMVDPVIYASYSLADTNRCFARRGVIIGMGKIITERLNLARSLSKADLPGAPLLAALSQGAGALCGFWPHIRQHNFTVAEPQPSPSPAPCQKMQGAGHPANRYRPGSLRSRRGNVAMPA